MTTTTLRAIEHALDRNLAEWRSDDFDRADFERVVDRRCELLAQAVAAPTVTRGDATTKLRIALRHGSDADGLDGDDVGFGCIGNPEQNYIFSLCRQAHGWLEQSIEPTDPA
ncbi:MAG: hypothetical protein ACREJ5_29390 [Geminicoccaceae bacterium]